MFKEMMRNEPINSLRGIVCDEGSSLTDVAAAVSADGELAQELVRVAKTRLGRCKVPMTVERAILLVGFQTVEALCEAAAR
jgi:HD-like signal output (HDOD) protein